jgi:GNAT superfamily N-acetyltransferase
MQHVSDWRVNQDVNNDEAYAILSQDPIWNCFALADLEAPLRLYSQFPTAYRKESNERAICLVLRHPSIGQVLSPFGAEEGVAAILKHLALPEHPLIQSQRAHISLLQHYYRPDTSWKELLRMTITPTSLRLQAHAPHQSVKQLTVSDVPALKNLYARYSENTFPADLFTRNIYFGVYEGEELVAAGGTHVVVAKFHIATLGNVLTAPQARRQGYATAITAALVTKLFEQHYSPVILNVFADNNEAIRIYERLGFQTRLKLLTGRATITTSK